MAVTAPVLNLQGMPTATSRPAVARSILDLIGNTPVARLCRLTGPEHAEVWGKLESCNPGGSVKDRICLAMVEAAEREGRLHPGDTIIEPTSGNTGIGLAVVAAVKGYRLVLTMPDTMSVERRSLLMAYGATLVLTEDSKGMHEAVRTAEAMLSEHPDYFMPQQFSNPANPDAHRRTTAQELLRQFPRIDAFVAGVGTGGTITGVAPVLRDAMPGVRIYAVEPESSPVLSHGEAGYHAIQGIGAGFVPEVLDQSAYDEVLAVSDADAAECTRRLARDEGILVGISAGANCHAALRVARELGPGKVVVTVFCDTGERYLTTDLFHREGI
jgi:cysteine synthase